MVNTAVKLCGIELDNPVIPASGTFGYGHEFAKIYDINCLGAFSIKGTTREPRFGNPAPRIADAPAGMLNSVGLQNPGVEAVAARELPELAKVYHKKVLANVCGFSVDEYVEVAARLDREDIVGWLELNVSCPNVHGGGMGFGTTCEGAATVTREVKRAVKKPVIVKLTPNVTDIAAIARACEEAGADGLSLINTVLAMRIDPAARKPVLANVTGGLSGSAVFPLALRCVYQVYEAVDIPIIGMGGVSSARGVIEMMLAGAEAVGVGAANLTNPFAAKEIIEALPAEMRKYGIENLADIIGGAHNG
ncbi:MAG TPA: dihydroorotate dehydrogenase [Candidatus Scatomorpha merdipullorum]|uniref:Dihydroorotate dehydrogenase n=1 Tax=Candidatus Scatomorpha merdipullorum TaxID=2840927 RepID=A0A9D1JUB3_9FIRM|nr:dihydroorotate dehydrogenase [Candidatus Scatomorpha merdipullorum]